MSKQIQNSATRGEAENPFPFAPGGSWAGITESTWKMMLDEFKVKNPGFDTGDFDKTTGKPGKGRFDQMWRDIKRIMSQIQTSVGGGRQDFRDFLQRVVDGTTGYIDSAVGLGIGPFNTGKDKDAEAFKHQVAMFLVICHMFEKKQRNTIPIVFQDPRFRTAEEFVLVTLAGYRIVQHPDALRYMTNSSFVFSPHMTWPGFEATVFKTLPALYIGNRIQHTNTGIGQILAESYIKWTYRTGIRQMGPEQLDIIRRADRFDGFYDRHEFSRIHDRIYKHARLNCFENIFVHIPKRAHPRPISPGSSSAATGPESGTHDGSGTGSHDGAPAPNPGFPASSSTATAPVNNTPAAPAFGFATANSVSTEPSPPTFEPRTVKNNTAPPQTIPATPVFSLSQISAIDTEPVAAPAAVPAIQPANSAPETATASTSRQNRAAAEANTPRTRSSYPRAPHRKTQEQAAQDQDGSLFNQRDLPHRNRTDKIQGIWNPQSKE